MIQLFRKKYSKLKLSPGITALYSNIVIDQIGSSLVGLFMPIFLWEKFGNLKLVLIYYFLLYFLYAVTIFFGAKVMSRLGQKTSMILSIPFKVLFYGCLYYLSLGYPIIIFVALMLTTIEIRMNLFWVPYHTNFAQFTEKHNRGRVIAFLTSISSFVAVFIPIVSGWIISNYGFEVLFLIALILIAVSILPLFTVRATFEKFSFSFRKTWSSLVNRKYRRMVGSYFATGVENNVGAIIWPIFIFQIMEGDFLKVGVVSSLIVLGTIVLRLIVGNFTDQTNKRKLLRWGSGLYALGWFLKIFVATGFQIFIISIYHNFAAIVMRTPFNALIYEQAADSGHYVDEFTVIREMALNLGRAACAVGLLILVAVLGIHWTFILAAIASLFVNFL